MTKERVLYGKKIVSHHMLTFAEQVYDIMVGEIERGRWQVDERLPGVINLAKELGFGTKTVQTAYDRLKQDGYTTTLGYRGTYLNSTHPQAAAASGKIGVLVFEERTGQPLELWYEHVISQLARRKNLVAEVRHLPSATDLSEVSRAGDLFDDDVGGLIALSPFRMSKRYADSEAALPVVYLCPPFERCAPKVCADIREAYYDLTSRVVRYGHRRVAFSEDSVEPDPRQTEMHREGYLDAMREHGLAVNESLMVDSRRVNNSDPESVKDHLRTILAMDERERPTVIVAGSLGRSMALTRVAAQVNVRIPEEVSVVSIGSAGIEGDRRITGMLPDFDRMVELCLTVLEEQKQSGRSDYTCIEVRMHYLPGHTLRPLPGASDTSSAADPDSARGQDLQTLSRTVHY